MMVGQGQDGRTCMRFDERLMKFCRILFMSGQGNAGLAGWWLSWHGACAAKSVWVTEFFRDRACGMCVFCHFDRFRDDQG